MTADRGRPVGPPEPATARPAPPPGGLALFGWRASAVLAVTAVAVAAGFGQFGAVATLGDVAKTFGHVTHGGSLAARVGLSGSTIGVGLAVIRLASIGG